MISSLISLLLVPLFPSLEPPNIAHAQEMSKLTQRLEQTGRPVVIDPSLLVFAPAPKPPLPNISGRLLAQQVGKPSNASTGQEAKTDVAWALTGVIHVGGRRVAILNDGSRDHVVAQGSFVSKQLKVSNLTANSAVLVSVGEAQAKPIRLLLTEISSTGASNE